MRWYHSGKTLHGEGHAADKVAEAVKTFHPAEALALWKALIESLAKHANRSTYDTAGHYLNEMRPVYERAGCGEEWRSFIAELRQKNARRPRMIDVLNRVEGRKSKIITPLASTMTRKH